VANLNADTTDVRLVAQDATHPVFLFSCSDAKNDRCTQPTGPLPYTQGTEVAAGVLGTLANANLITGTDPFDPVGSDFPHDSTIEVKIAKSRLPNGPNDQEAVLANVCSYPSAGNGGNNNPFDCVVSPGGGFLSIVKDAGAGVTTPTFDFTVTNPTTTRAIDGSGTATPIAVLISANPSTSVTEAAETNWSLTDIDCLFEDGTTSTGTVSLANRKVTGVAVQSGKVTTCTFVNTPVQPKLTVTKVVVNDNGGTLAVADFPLFVDTTSVTSGVKNGFDAGNHTVSETEDDGYTATITGDCAADGSVTLALGDDKSCTITNDDKPGTLIVKKVVDNENGGTLAADDFSFQVDGATAVDFEADGQNDLTVNAGTYDVTEPTVAGYTTSYDNCTDVVVTNGGSATCTITNTAQAATLIVKKVVVNDNGGALAAEDFSFQVDGGTAIDFEADGQNNLTVDAGTYDVTEPAVEGYDTTYENCTDIVIALGGTATCTITNDDTKASPSGSTVQSWILHDSLTIEGIRAGAPNADEADVDFAVYANPACTGTPVGTETNRPIAAGAASTDTGITVTASGTYYWLVTYSGDDYNNGFTTDCGDEITQILAKDAFGGGRDDFAP
jgi:hypothetical protein